MSGGPKAHRAGPGTPHVQRHREPTETPRRAHSDTLTTETRFGPEHPNIPSREGGRFPCPALRETVQVLHNAGIKLTAWPRRS
jgi:hypothetical protein